MSGRIREEGETCWETGYPGTAPDSWVSQEVTKAKVPSGCGCGAWSRADPAVGAGVLWLLHMSLQSEALSQSAIKYLLFPTQLSLVAGPGRGDQRTGDRELFIVNNHLLGVT